MKLPSDSLIAEKSTRYLLVPWGRGDKSRFLLPAGYTLENYAQLAEDIRKQILSKNAIPAGQNEFGRYFEIRGSLRGPNGGCLNVRTIWMTEHLSGKTKLVTLFPDKQMHS